MTTTLTPIPLIDFEPFSQGNVADREAIARQIHQAYHEIGFMYLKHPGIEPDLIERLFARSKQFFDLPFAAKQAIAWSDEVSNRGYIGVERERLDPNKPGDLKEAFNVGKELDPASFPAEPQASLGMNQWPAELPEFRATVLEFFDACADAALTVLEAMAIALQAPPDFFVAPHRQQSHTLRLLHYPPLAKTPKPEQVRAGVHSDYGSITLLFQDDVGGLEVKTRQGEWISAPAIPGTLIVNTGDLMERWTNHEFRSTQHRVRTPTEDQAGRSRYSVAFFCHPDDEAEIACIESCQGGDRPALYPPISAGAYLLEKLRATY